MWRNFAVVLLTWCAMGCGSGDVPRGAASGKVTLDGEPILKGTIMFLPTGENSGGSATAEIVEGKYVIPRKLGPAIGQHRVEVIAVRNNGKKEAGSPYPPGTMVDDIEQYVPPKFNHQSELKADVKSGDNTLSFDLKP